MRMVLWLLVLWALVIGLWFLSSCSYFNHAEKIKFEIDNPPKDIDVKVGVPKDLS